MLYFLTGLHRLRHNSQMKNITTRMVTVVVAVRNEVKNIAGLLNDLHHQTYPKNKLQIIFANDRSTDGTADILNEYSAKIDNLSVVTIDKKSNQMTPKKNALSKAIEQAIGELIISTDGDCRVPTTWVESMVSTFNNDTGIVVGYSKIDAKSDNFFDHYQAVDFLALMTANAGTLGWGNPWTGSGQNLAYRLSAYHNIDGFNPVAKRVSGDDHYLIDSISKIAKTRYNISPKSFVTTQPVENTKQFISQRIRWASNTRNLFNTNWLFLSFLIITFLVNIIILTSYVNPALWSNLPMLIGVKFLIDSIVLFYGSNLFKTPVKIPVYLTWFFVQPVYIPLLGLLSSFGKYKWKN